MAARAKNIGGQMAGAESNPIELLERRLEDLLSRLEKTRQENGQLRTERDALKDRIMKLIGDVDKHLGES
jgi:hypothetical protein